MYIATMIQVNKKYMPMYETCKITTDYFTEYTFRRVGKLKKI